MRLYFLETSVHIFNNHFGITNDLQNHYTKRGNKVTGGKFYSADYQQNKPNQAFACFHFKILIFVVRPAASGRLCNQAKERIRYV
jgi:hypothetical protein